MGDLHCQLTYQQQPTTVFYQLGRTNNNANLVNAYLRTRNIGVGNEAGEGQVPGADASTSRSVEDASCATLSANVHHHLFTTSAHAVTWPEVPRALRLGDTEYLGRVRAYASPACAHLCTIDLGVKGGARESQGSSAKAPSSQNEAPRPLSLAGTKCREADMATTAMNTPPVASTYN